MKKLHLDGINSGNYPNQRTTYERIVSFSNGFIDLSATSIAIKTKNNQSFSSSLQKTEEDAMSETYQGTFEDGTAFRLIRPSSAAKSILSIQGIAETLTFGGLARDSYAVHFNLVPENSPD